jgi:poly-D-alanine transfer protein DltD
MTKTTYATWTRLNHKGPLHDNRRLLRHREKNCECDKCYRELAKLPPAETIEERIAKHKNKLKEKEMKKVKKITKAEVRSGKQKTINTFFKSVGP